MERRSLHTSRPHPSMAVSVVFKMSVTIPWATKLGAFPWPRPGTCTLAAHGILVKNLQHKILHHPQAEFLSYESPNLSFQSSLKIWIPQFYIFQIAKTNYFSSTYPRPKLAAVTIKQLYLPDMDRGKLSRTTKLRMLQLRAFDVQHDSTIHVLIASLSKTQKALAMDLFVHLSREEFENVKSRLVALPVTRFCNLARWLEGLSDRRLLMYLRYMTGTLEVTQRESASNMTPVAVPDSSIECQPPPLPAEISAMMLDKYYEAIFIPGEIEPCSSLKHVNDDVFLMEDVFWYHGEELSVLDRKLYGEYKRRYWSENTLVSTSQTYE